VLTRCKLASNVLSARLLLLAPPLLLQGPHFVLFVCVWELDEGESAAADSCFIVGSLSVNRKTPQVTISNLHCSLCAPALPSHLLMVVADNETNTLHLAPRTPKLLLIVVDDTPTWHWHLAPRTSHLPYLLPIVFDDSFISWANSEAVGRIAEDLSMDCFGRDEEGCIDTCKWNAQRRDCVPATSDGFDPDAVRGDPNLSRERDIVRGEDAGRSSRASNP
jgi:hypothetical protein